MGSLAQEIRSAYAFVQVQSSSPGAIRASVESSAVMKKVAATGGPSRLCYVYALPCAWDAKRPRKTKDNRSHDKRVTRPTPLWKDDFECFLLVVNPLVTPTNQSVIAVAVGKCKRGGAGLLAEAGQGATNQIIELVMKTQTEAAGKDLPPWRVKTITFVATPQCGRSMGVSGNLTETLCYFYRGTWPSKLKPRARSVMGGSTWDDMWIQAAPPADTPFEVPYVVKELVMENAWLACLGARGAADKEEGESAASGEEGSQEEKGKEEKGKEQKGKEKGKEEKGKDEKGKGKKKKEKGKSKKKESSKKQNSAKKAGGKKSGNSSKKKDTKSNKNNTSSKKKDNKKKEGKNKDPASYQSSAVVLPRAEYLEVDPLVQPGGEAQDMEPLFSKDYHSSVWEQIYTEFDSAGAIVWTPGNSTAVFAAIKSELPILAIALNETHAAIIQHAVDCRIVHAVQAQSGSQLSWMKTYSEDAAGIKRKLDTLRAGQSLEEDSSDEPKKKKGGKKDAGGKKKGADGKTKSSKKD